MTLTRETVGLVVRDQFNRADSDALGNNWTDWEASATDVRIVSNQVACAAVAANTGGFRPAAEVGAAQDIIAQANVRISGSNSGVVRARADGTANTEAYQLAARRDVGAWELIRRRASANTVLCSSTTSPPGDLEWRGLRGVIEGAVVRLLSTAALANGQVLTEDFVLRCQATDGTPLQTFDRTGFQHGAVATTMDFDEFFVCGRNLVVTGLPAGWKVQVDGRAAVVESGGSVTINIDTWALPATTLKILDDADVEQDSITPSGGIWGGDEYSFAAAGATQLAFGQQPTDAIARQVLNPAVTVEARNDQGGIDTGFTGDITVALADAQGAILGGTLTVAAVNGVATFDDLTVDKAGTYQLRATAAGLTEALSISFVIVAWQSAPAVAGVWASPPSVSGGDELVREAIGLLARHEQDSSPGFPFNLAHWVADPGLIALSIDTLGEDAGSLILTAQVAGHRSVARYEALPARTAYFVHGVEHLAVVNTTLDMGVAAHVGSVSFPENWVAFWTKADAFGDPPRQDLTALSYRVDGAQTFVEIVDIPPISNEQDRRLSLAVDGASFRGFDHDTGVAIVGSSPLGSGQAGVSIERGGAAAAIAVRHLFIMMSSRIQMRGVPATWTWELRTLADALIAAFPGSTTVINVLTDIAPPPAFPWLIKVQVRDELGALHRELIPADGVWGGDEYRLGIGGEWSSGPAAAGSWSNA